MSILVKILIFTILFSGSVYAQDAQQKVEAIIGKLILENVTLSSTVENLNKQIADLKKQLADKEKDKK